jgi:hypothetical protein
MRSGTWRGVSLAVVLAATLATGRSARANDPFHPIIPREIDAIDINTGGPYLAPPVPYGHYAKGGLLGGAMGKLHGLGSLGGLHGLGQSGHCGDPGCDGTSGHLKRFKNCGLCKGKGCGVCTSTILASSQAIAAPVAASPQGPSHCGVKGCGLGLGHKHGGDKGWGDGCHHGSGVGCGNCFGGKGLGGHGPGNACNACGGKGCGLCMGGHGGLGGVKGKLYGLLHPHAGKVEYFVGAGGPVPITPGYVPYVISTRSPRDFLSFPPYTP